MNENRGLANAVVGFVSSIVSLVFSIVSFVFYGKCAIDFATNEGSLTAAGPNAKNSLIFGIVALVLALVGIISGALGVKCRKVRGLAICGIVFGAIFIIVAIVATSLGGATLAAAKLS